jgi:hypothetical protein
MSKKHCPPFTWLIQISAFVGMGVMVLLFPLPGYVAKLVQSAYDLFAMDRSSLRSKSSGPTAASQKDRFPGSNCD